MEKLNSREIIQKINILEFFKKMGMAQKFSLRMAAFIACILLVVSFVFTKGSTGGYQKKLDNAVSQLNVLSPVKEINEKLNKVNLFIKDIRKLDVSAGSILKEFSSIAPSLLYFETLGINCQAKTGKITGYIKSYQKAPDTILAGFVGAMNNCPIFKAVNVSTSEETLMDKEKITKFQITFGLS